MSNPYSEARAFLDATHKRATELAQQIAACGNTPISEELYALRDYIEGVPNFDDDGKVED